MGVLPVTFASNAFREPPTAWTRVEAKDGRFIRSCAEHVDGVVIPLRFDDAGRNDPGDRDRQADGDLRRAALETGVPFIVDLEVHRTAHLESREDESFGKDRRTAVARAIPLPLTSVSLESDDALGRLVRACLRAQVGAAAVFAPTFTFTSVADPWFRVNLRAIRMMQELLGRRSVAAWIHVSLATMESGQLAAAVPALTRELRAGATVALTVSDIRPDLSVDALASYFEALRAFDDMGLRLMVDRASEVAVAAVATYAVGSIIGVRLYRTAPASPKYENPFNPKMPLKYQEFGRVRRLPRAVAADRAARGKLRPCPHPECSAASRPAKSQTDSLLVRLHNAHVMKYEFLRVRRLGAPQLMRGWASANLKHLRTFAQAVELANERRDVA